MLFFLLSCLLVGVAASDLAMAAPAPTNQTLRVTEKILYRFTGGNDGAHPKSGVVMDSAGNLYGTTYGTRFSGGKACRACGTGFEIAAGTHKETVLYRFKGGPDGAGPEGELFMDSAGNLYGTTLAGGSNCEQRMELGPGCGTVFEIIRN